MNQRCTNEIGQARLRFLQSFGIASEPNPDGMPIPIIPTRSVGEPIEPYSTITHGRIRPPNEQIPTAKWPL
jgi:hypothetical protein